MKKYEERHDGIWQVPYLPIDPSDLGREYEALVRINSQSGKGGVAFVMDHCYGFKLPKTMQKEFADVIQKISEGKGEVSPTEVMDAFTREYLERQDALKLDKCQFFDYSETNGDNDTKVNMNVVYNGQARSIEGIGNGPIDAFKNAIGRNIDIDLSLIHI